jgi:hypothetical protein
LATCGAVALSIFVVVALMEIGLTTDVGSFMSNTLAMQVLLSSTHPVNTGSEYGVGHIYSPFSFISPLNP